MLTRKIAIERVKLFTDNILAPGIPLDRVILFGSYVRDQQHEDSDIDVALVSNIFTGLGFNNMQYFARINNQKEFIDIETKTFSTDYFEKGDPFIQEILDTGIEVYNSKATKQLSDRATERPSNK